MRTASRFERGYRRLDVAGGGDFCFDCGSGPVVGCSAHRGVDRTTAREERNINPDADDRACPVCPFRADDNDRCRCLPQAGGMIARGGNAICPHPIPKYHNMRESSAEFKGGYPGPLRSRTNRIGAPNKLNRQNHRQEKMGYAIFTACCLGTDRDRDSGAGEKQGCFRKNADISFCPPLEFRGVPDACDGMDRRDVRERMRVMWNGPRVLKEAVAMNMCNIATVVLCAVPGYGPAAGKEGAVEQC